MAVLHPTTPPEAAAVGSLDCWCSAAASFLVVFWASAAASALVVAIPPSLVPGMRSFHVVSEALIGRGLTSPSPREDQKAGRSFLHDLLHRFTAWTVPHDWFWHFYLLGSLVTLSLLTLTSTLLPPSTPTLLLLLLFQAHVLRRLWESTRHMRHVGMHKAHESTRHMRQPLVPSSFGEAESSTQDTRHMRQPLAPPPSKQADSSSGKAYSSSKGVESSAREADTAGAVACAASEQHMRQPLAPPPSGEEAESLSQGSHSSSGERAGLQRPLAPSSAEARSHGARRQSRMHVAGYAVGISYYVATPLTLFLQIRHGANPCPTALPSPGPPSGATESCSVETCSCPTLETCSAEEGEGMGVRLSGVLGLSLHSLSLDSLSLDSLSLDSLPSDGAWGVALCALGLGLFLWGSWHQYRCHRILWELKQQGRGYGIPRGDWFLWLSCPHYTAEVVLYVGLVFFAVGGSRGLSRDVPLILLLLWVISNLSVAALRVHQKYIKTFKDYPLRSAIFPGLL